MEPFDFKFGKPEYEHLVRDAAARLKARGLDRPSEFPPGKYHLMRERVRGAYYYRLYYRLVPSNRHIFIGSFYVPIETVPNIRSRRRTKGIRPGHVFQLTTGAHVRVQVDTQGLPWPEWLGY